MHPQQRTVTHPDTYWEGGSGSATSEQLVQLPATTLLPWIGGHMDPRLLIPSPTPRSSSEAETILNCSSSNG